MQIPANLAAEYQRGYVEGVASVTPEDGVTQADVDAARTMGFNDGVASVDITTDNADAFADGAASVTPEDGINQLHVDAAREAGRLAGIASVIAEDGINQTHVDAAYADGLADGIASVIAEDGIHQSHVDAAREEGRLAGIASVDITTDNADAYADGEANVRDNDPLYNNEDGVHQSDVDAARQAGIDSVDITTDNEAIRTAAYNAGFTAGAASITPEDGVTQADVDAARQAGIDSVTAEDGHHSTIVDSGTDTHGTSVFMVTGTVPSATTGRFIRAESYEAAVNSWNIQRTTAINEATRLTAERDAANTATANAIAERNDARDDFTGLIRGIRVAVGADVTNTELVDGDVVVTYTCLLYTSPSPRD